MASSPAVQSLSVQCPAGWQVVPLSDMAYFQEGPGILAKDFRDLGVPLVRLKGVEGDYVTLDGCNYLDPDMVTRKWSQFQLAIGDLLISTSASLGRVSVVTTETAGAIPYTGLIRFKPKDGRVKPEYLKAFLGSAAFRGQAEAMASGSVIRHFGPSHIKQMAILVPPLWEQMEIGAIASLLDARLRLLRETNAALESIAQAIFKSWFIDFDPVRAKAEGREPEGMDANTAALFPSEFEDWELGLIPKGWRSGTLGDLADLNGSTWSAKRHPSVIRYVDLGNVKANSIADILEFQFTDAPSRARRELRAGDTIVGTVRPGNRSFAYIEESQAGLTGSTGFAVLSPRQPSAREFVYLAATTAENIARLANLADGAAYPAVRPEVVSATPGVFPPDEVLGAFSGIVAPLFSRKAETDRVTSSLSDLRDALLPRLISGRLRLSDVREDIEAAIA